MENESHNTPLTTQSTPSREELEYHIRARAWKDNTFRQEFLTNPKAVLERDYAQYFSCGKVPSELSIKVIEEEEQAICFVLPPISPEDQISDLEIIDNDDLESAHGGSGIPSRHITCISCWCTVECTKGCTPSWYCKSGKLMKRIKL